MNFALFILALGIVIAIIGARKPVEKSAVTQISSLEENAEKAKKIEKTEEKPITVDCADKPMVLRVTGEGEKVEYDSRTCSTKRLMWVSRETAPDGNPMRIRTPGGKSNTYKCPLPFRAADKIYTSLDSLTKEQIGEDIYLDCHGRVVLNIKERFPCFDIYDLRNETRHYRWWIIIEEEYISRVFHTDERSDIFVTDDVAEVEECCLDALKKYGMII